MSNIDKRAYSVSQIIADLKLKHGSGDTYAPIMRWDELLALLDELEDYKAAYEEESRDKEVQRSVIDDALCKLLPGCHYMDLPDGGSVTPLEQVSRMIADYSEQLQAAEKRISELTEALKKVASGYKSCLRTGHDRILDLGGDCDSPEVMIAGNPDIQQAEKLLSAAAGKGE